MLRDYVCTLRLQQMVLNCGESAKRAVVMQPLTSSWLTPAIKGCVCG